MGLVLEAVTAAVQMLTRIPVPSPPRAPDERTVALSAVFYPWVGLALGGVGLLAFEGLAPRISPEFGALVVLALWALATGALHEDGLADVADAFGSQRDREGAAAGDEGQPHRRLRRVGVDADAARLEPVGGLARGGAVLGFLASQSLGRAGIVLLAGWAGPGTTGMGGALARGVKARHMLAAAIPPALLLCAVGPLEDVLWCMAASLAVVVGAVFYFRARLGGVTGDCLGAAFIAQEIAILLALRTGWA